MGIEASEALRSIWHLGSVLVLLRSWHFLTERRRLLQSFEHQRHQWQFDIHRAMLHNRVLERSYASKDREASLYNLVRSFQKWKGWMHACRLGRRIARALPRRLLEETWSVWISFLQDCKLQREHDVRFGRQSQHLKGMSGQVAAQLYLLFRCSACSVSFHAWALLMAEQRHRRRGESQKELHRNAVLKLLPWCASRSRVGECTSRSFERWVRHLKGRRLIARITQLTYSRVLEKDATLLSDAWNAWQKLLNRLHGFDRLQLRWEQEKSTVGTIHLAFQCWRYFLAVAVQERLGLRTRGHSEQLLQAAARHRCKQELRVSFVAWCHYFCAGRRVDAATAFASLAQAEVWQSHCFKAWRIGALLSAKERTALVKRRCEDLEQRSEVLCRFLRRGPWLSAKSVAFRGWCLWHRSQGQRCSALLLLRCYRAWSAFAMQCRRREWAESARQDRYLLRHCLGAWRAQILEKHQNEAYDCNKKSERLKQQLRQVEAWLRQHVPHRAFRMPAIFSQWRSQVLRKSQVLLKNQLLLSSCMREWAQSWSSRRYATSKVRLLALETFCQRQRCYWLQRQGLRVCRRIFSAWWQSAVSKGLGTVLSGRMCKMQRMCSLQRILSSWMAAVCMKQCQRLRHFSFQKQFRESQKSLSMTVLILSFYHWRGGSRGSPPRLYAYTLLLKCLGHRTLLELVFGAWRSLRSLSPETRIEPGVVEAADEMLELCKCLETQNADLLLLLQERANANTLLELELNPGTSPGS